MTDIHDRPWAPYAPASVVIPVLQELAGAGRTADSWAVNSWIELGVSHLQRESRMVGTIAFPRTH